jgi:membrane protein implicated in regulation of membrane protease activity
MDIWLVLVAWAILGVVAVLALARVLRRTSSPHDNAVGRSAVTGTVHRLNS